MATEEYHALRRRQVAEAVERLVAEHGLAAVTIAKAAAEAAVSVGLVQHYFASKDDLLRYAYTQVTERALARAQQRAQELDAHHGSIRRALGESLAERLPLDETRQAEWRVLFAFTARAVDQPILAAVRNQTEAALRAQVAQAITNGKECGEVPPDTDADPAAAGLLAIVEGLSLHAYLDPATMPASVALAELNRALMTVLPGQCRQYD
ncbi:TetR family transcriptional regulator C-terminal domain-containing protein [Saccharomonospora sp. NPDC046836]|uniref:TetR/AcrR family transcriptional regulator n=1 Tax=Saccharomonospora sp. NPDC046836 TaxID=3156921 RepID=UPI0034000CAF